MSRIGGSTRVYALLGDPVAHSLSPAMQNAAFTALGIDAVYVALRCRSEDVAALMRALALQGGGGNVTLPHKEAAARALADSGGGPAATINTFWGESGGLRGAETDSAGILAALRDLGTSNGDWCLIGTGGSARAALHAARAAGARVAVRSRSPERAARFLEAARAAGVGEAEARECRLVINCTPLGLHDGDPLPLPPDELPPGSAALDLVYRPGGTAWVRCLRGRGVRAADGREVLLGQGIAAFERWFPGVRAPAEIMRAALANALR